MLISYRWLEALLGALPDARTVAERLTLAGLEVESVTREGARLEPITLARVVSSRPHPSSKNPLTLVTVDLGEGREPLEVVCGAPNVPAPGGVVCFAPIGAQVLDAKGQPFTLVEKPVAGVVSRGMLCAEDELGLGTDHAGIIVLPEGRAGARLLDAIPSLDDWILSVNVTPNRPDALGHVGVARDLAALLNIAFSSPTPEPPRAIAGRAASIRVRLDDPAGCPRYCAAQMDEVTVGPSPLWARARLHRLGVRPINNVVDATNLVMLEDGQPLHAFDLREVGDGAIVVRRARDKEKIQTLDGVHRELDDDDVVIADARGRALALAGVMGGEGSGIKDDTTSVLLESAYFDPRAVRRSARRHGIHSEASHRFERETDVSNPPRSLAKLASLLGRLAGAGLVGAPVDAFPSPPAKRTLALRHARVAAVLGTAVPPAETARVLDALGFAREQETPDAVTVAVPFHRPDVTREIDLIEEVARVRGYDAIPSAVPPTAGARAGVTRDYRARRRLRETLAALGLDEAVSYAFISPDEVARVGLANVPVVELQNPLSRDRSVMRPSLLPRLLVAVGHAARHGVPRVRLFEIGTVFSPEGAPERGLASERTRVAIVMAGPRDAYLTRATDVDFYDAKGVVEALVARATFATPRYHTDGPAPPWAHPRRFAHVELDGAPLGVVAELHPDVREAFELPRSVVVADLDGALLAQPKRTPQARAPGRYPVVRRDVALEVAQTQPAGAIAESLRTAAGAQCERVELFDRYAGPELPAGSHSLAFALYFRSDERTLKDEEVDGWTQAALAAASEAFGARQR